VTTESHAAIERIVETKKIDGQLLRPRFKARDGSGEVDNWLRCVVRTGTRKFSAALED
jgi:hypothetical protein